MATSITTIADIGLNPILIGPGLTWSAPGATSSGPSILDVNSGTFSSSTLFSGTFSGGTYSTIIVRNGIIVSAH